MDPVHWGEREIVSGTGVTVSKHVQNLADMLSLDEKARVAVASEIRTVVSHVIKYADEGCMKNDRYMVKIKKQLERLTLLASAIDESIKPPPSVRPSEHPPTE